METDPAHRLSAKEARAGTRDYSQPLRGAKSQPRQAFEAGLGRFGSVRGVEEEGQGKAETWKEILSVELIAELQDADLCR